MTSPIPPLRVCHIFAGTDGGSWVHDQLVALRDDYGCDVTVVLGGPEGRGVDRCRASGIPIKVADFKLGGVRALVTLPWKILKLARWLRRERFDVVQTHVIQSTLLGRPAAWLADVPVRLVMVTGPFYMQAESTRWMERATVWMETGVVPSCHLTADLYREAGVAERLILPTLYYGPSAPAFDPARTVPAGLRDQYGLAPGTPLIGSVAMFYPKMGGGSFVPVDIHHCHLKGHVELIAAMPRILEQFPDAKLVLIGMGWSATGEDALEEMRALARASGLEDHIIFTGYRADIAAIYMDLDVSVQAALNDNLGGTVESLLMARPTVATRVGGLVDSVIDGQTGVLVAPRDAEDLARGILRLLSDPADAARLGTAGRALMLDHFTLETTARELAALYRRQRDAAPGAWRPMVSFRRLFVALALHPTVLCRALLVDFYLKTRTPRTLAYYRHRARHIALKLAKKTGLVRRPA